MLNIDRVEGLATAPVNAAAQRAQVSSPEKCREAET